MHGITEDMISPNALEAARKLIDTGYEARIFGGAMRDIVMGAETRDFDIVTDATIERQLELMDNMTFHSVQTGQTFGYVHYPDEIVDLAQCMNVPAAYYGMDGVPDFDPEALYSDSFIFDSFERELPINAICYDVATGDLVDYHGGFTRHPRGHHRNPAFEDAYELLMIRTRIEEGLDTSAEYWTSTRN